MIIFYFDSKKEKKFTFFNRPKKTLFREKNNHCTFKKEKKKNSNILFLFKIYSYVQTI